MSPAYQGDLLHLANYPVLNGTFSAATYTLYFGVDTLRNGTLDVGNALFYDSIVVTIN